MTYPLKKRNGVGYAEQYRAMSADRRENPRRPAISLLVTVKPGMSRKRADELREYFRAVAGITASTYLSPADKKAECCKLHELVYRGVR